MFSSAAARRSRWPSCAATPHRRTPADSGEQRLQAFQEHHGYPGRNPAGELLKRFRAGVEGRADEFELQARRQVVLALVSALEPVVARINELTTEIRDALEAHADGPTFRSLFIAKDSWLCAATMLAEIGDRRHHNPGAADIYTRARSSTPPSRH